MPASQVAPQHVDEAREHHRAQQRTLLRQRVGDAHGLTSVVVGRQAELVGELVGDERIAQHLGEARPRERIGDDAPRLLAVREAATLRGRRGDRGDVVVAVDPGDLLRVVGCIGQIGTPRRRGDEHVRLVGALSGLVDRAAEVAQDREHPVTRVVDAHDAAGLRDVEQVCRALRRVVDIGHAGVGTAAAVLDEQVDGQLGRCCRHPRVDAALEALGRLRDEAVAARGARHGRGVEVGGLDEHVGRRVVHLGGSAAHDAGDGERPLAGVGDEQVLGAQRALDVVEGRQGLTGAGASHDDRAVELGEVVGVERLPDGEHHVVGDVDGEADRTHPHLGQTLLHPRGRRPRRVDATHDAGHEAVAADDAVDGRVVLEADRVAVVVGLGGGDGRRVAVATGRAALGVPELAGESTHREAVPTVRGHVGLDGLLGEAEQGDGVVAGGQGRGLLGTEQSLEDDDALVVVPEADLVLGADHAVGDVAVRLACGDGEVAGQDGSRQHDDDEVTHLEVVGAADDLLVLALGQHLAVLADVDGAPADGLAVLLGLEGNVEHPADDERPGEVTTVEVLLLEADGDESGSDVGAAGPLGQLGELGEPAEWHPHVRPPSRTAARSAGRPRPCRACPARRDAASVPSRCRARRRTRSRCRGRCRRSAAPCG